MTRKFNSENLFLERKDAETQRLILNTENSKILVSGKTKTRKTPLCSKRLIAFIMYWLDESLLVKTPSCLAGILPREGAGKASAERPNENVHATTASCPFMGKDVRRTERGLIPLCEGWNINEKT